MSDLKLKLLCTQILSLFNAMALQLNARLTRARSEPIILFLDLSSLPVKS